MHHWKFVSNTHNVAQGERGKIKPADLYLKCCAFSSDFIISLLQGDLKFQEVAEGKNAHKPQTGLQSRVYFVFYIFFLYIMYIVS